MRRPRRILATLAIAVAAVAAGPAPAQDTVESLNQRIQALEKRIATLEQMLSQKLTAIEQKLAQPQAQGQPQQPNPQEQAATAAFAQINQLVASGDYDKARASMVEFMKTYPTTRAAASARKLNEELSVIGKDAPATWGIQKWYQGEKDVDLKAANKTTLVVFWEEWCPHCRREMPKLQQTFDGLKGSGLQVVGLTKVTRNVTDDQVTQFLTEQKVSYPIAKEDGTLSTYFGVSGIPAAAVVKNGKVIWRGHPAQLDEAKLKSWL